MIVKTLVKVLHSKLFFVFGFTCGLYISLTFRFDDRANNCGALHKEYVSETPFIDENQPKPLVRNGTGKVNRATPTKQLNRPRYYSTELGIRDKIFVAVLSSVERLNGYGLAINNTLGNSVNKIKFFVDAAHANTAHLPVGNVVGFTDNREVFQPFHVFKYIADNFLQDYDFFYLMLDKTYVNGPKLKQMVKKISISEDVYLGSRIHESSYCSLDAGILLSNSIIRKIKENLIWCVKNSISNDHSENIGRCVVHSAALECHSAVQGQTYKAYKTQYYNIAKYLSQLANKETFTQALTIHPVLNVTDAYVLHNYFSQRLMNELKSQVEELKESIVATNHLNPPEYQTLFWPIGDAPFSRPLTRFDVKRYDYFNDTHIFARDDFSVIDPIDAVMRYEIEEILEAVKGQIFSTYNNTLVFEALWQGYKFFDPTRGLNYVVDVKVRDTQSLDLVVKRFEICKVLGRAEITPVPYVTENTRVTIILPVHIDEIDLVKTFLSFFAENIMPRREKAFLMLTFLYGNNTPSKGREDVFYDVKTLAQKTMDLNKASTSRLAWVSIKFPTNTIDRSHRLIHFAVIDLALRKIGPDALILYLDVYADLKFEFLNRVRMNTIQQFQMFLPVPFMQYNPVISKQTEIDVNKNCGRFDQSDLNYFSFYAKDYIKIRKQTEKVFPIVRNDRDIPNLINEQLSNPVNATFTNFVDYFVKNAPHLHFFRAIEPSLRVKYTDSCTLHGKTTSLKNQLAAVVMEYQKVHPYK